MSETADFAFIPRCGSFPLLTYLCVCSAAQLRRASSKAKLFVSLKSEQPQL